MRRSLAGVAGFVAGVVLVAAALLGWMRPLFFGTTTTALPIESLAPGASQWEILESWPPEPVDTGLADPRDPRRPTRQWVPRSADEALASYLDDPPCELVREPGHRPAPSLPADCLGIEAIAKLGDGSVLAIIVEGPAYGAWLLAADASAWRELDPPPPEAHGRIVAGPGDRAVYGGDGEALASLRDGHWQRLPPNRYPRQGFGAMQVLADGTIVIGSGQGEEAGWVTTVFSLLPLLVMTAIVAGAVLARRRWQLDLVGAMIGAGLALVLAVAAILAILPALAWR